MVLSSCEAEYVDITSALYQEVWIARLVKEVLGVEMEAVKIMVENQSAIMLSKTLAHHNRTNHIATKYHFIQDCIEDGRVVMKHVKTKDQLTDILTKSFGRVKFSELSARIRVKKAWDVKKIKEENVRVDFPSLGTAGAHGTAMARRGEHPACTIGAHLVGTIAPAKQALRGMRRHAWTSANAHT